MGATLEKSERSEKVKLKVYQDENHMSIAICEVNWGISTILDPEGFLWPPQPQTLQKYDAYSSTATPPQNSHCSDRMKSH